jgi:hypothetical protein
MRLKGLAEEQLAKSKRGGSASGVEILEKLKGYEEVQVRIAEAIVSGQDDTLRKDFIPKYLLEKAQTPSSTTLISFEEILTQLTTALTNELNFYSTHKVLSSTPFKQDIYDVKPRVLTRSSVSVKKLSP